MIDTTIEYNGNIIEVDSHEYEIYLDYFNNFLSIDSWAEYYSLTKKEALRLHAKYNSGNGTIWTHKH